MLHLDDVKVSELARELDINPRKILNLLRSWGTNGAATPTSWVRAGLAERVRAHIAIARKHNGNYSLERSNPPAKLKRSGKFKAKCPNCKNMIEEVGMAHHVERCPPRVRRVPRMIAIPKGPIAQLVEFAATRGIPEGAVREQLKRAGSNPEEIRAILEKLPAVENHAYSAAAERMLRNSLPIGRLPFTVLPPGTWDAAHVVNRYREINRSAHAWEGRKLDLNRLTALVSLCPTRCYLGTELWSWYVLFEFEPFDAAVLECPYEGNATYVIHGEWQSVAGQTKQEIREKFPDRCTWVVHKNGWLKRISEALRREPAGARAAVLRRN